MHETNCVSNATVEALVLGDKKVNEVFLFSCYKSRIMMHNNNFNGSFNSSMKNMNKWINNKIIN